MEICLYRFWSTAMKSQNKWWHIGPKNIIQWPHKLNSSISPSSIKRNWGIFAHANCFSILFTELKVGSIVCAFHLTWKCVKKYTTLTFFFLWCFGISRANEDLAKICSPHHDLGGQTGLQIATVSNEVCRSGLLILFPKVTTLPPKKQHLLHTHHS